MVMMITRFHRLIQSRLLWAVFLVVIVFSFVIWGTQTPSEGRRAEEANAAGKLDGTFVPREEFTQAYFNTYMAVALGLGRRFDIDDTLDAQLRKSAWRRLAALRQAKQLGIETSDEEVLATLQSQPAFMVEGRFNPNAYAAFIQNLLAPMGFSDAHFERHVREEITLQKLQHVIQQAVLIAPLDIVRTFRSLTDEFEVQHVTLSKDSVAGDVSITEDEAHAFYLSDPEAFTIPAQVLVQYVEIPIESLLEQATVTNENDALAYYDQFIDTFVVTNEVTIKRTELSDDGDLIEIEVVTNRAETIGFDLVKTNILEILTRRAAADLAADAAVDFVVHLAPDRQGQAPSFEEAALRSGFTLSSPPPFGLADEVPGVDAGRIFNLTAFALSPNPEEYFSDAVPGSNYVYVIGLKEKIAPRVPEFEEIKDQAMQDTREKALNDALSKKVQSLREAVVEAVEGSGTFAEAVAAFELEAVEVGPFTLATGSETNGPPELLIRGILPRNEGEVTDALTTPDGDIMLAYVARRSPGDSSLLPSIAPQIRETVRRQRSQILFQEWENHLLAKAGFEDLLSSSARDWDDEDEMDEESYEADEEKSTD